MKVGLSKTGNQLFFQMKARLTVVGQMVSNMYGKRNNSAPMSYHIESTIKHNGGSLMVWGCITYQGVGYLCRIDGGLDAELYCSILEEEFLNTLDFCGLTKHDTIFQQDKDPKNTSKKAKK